MKIVFLDADTLGGVSLDPIRKLGELTVYDRSTQAEAAERISDAHVLIINKVSVTEDLMACAPELELICIAATGTDNVDLQAAARRGIAVRNVVGYSTDSVAQLVFAQLLTLVVRPERYDCYVKSGRYFENGLFTEISNPYHELAGKTMGIAGMGKIGQKVASIAAAFGMDVIYYPTSGVPHCPQYKNVGLEELLRRSDVLSVHCPLNDRTRGLIGREQIELMKPTAYIINMARGGIVDETALVSALDRGIIAGAAVDVFTSEPVQPFKMDHPERLLLSPHVAWTSSEAILRLVSGIASNIEEFTKSRQK